MRQERDLSNLKLDSDRVAIQAVAIGDTNHAAKWNEQTVMAGPGLPEMPVPTDRRVTAGYRVGVYIYEYECDALDQDGAFVARDTKVPAATHVQRSELSPLGIER